MRLNEIIGYIPYGLNIYTEYYDVIADVIGIKNNDILTEYYTESKGGAFDRVNIRSCKPILRPLSDLHKEIIHNGEKIIPIIELAKICFRKSGYDAIIEGEKCYAIDNSGYKTYRFMFDYSHKGFYAMSLFRSNNKICEDIYIGVFNQIELFDKLNEYKIDYRGLINKGEAISTENLKEEIYK